jgi:hypothetical protein
MVEALPLVREDSALLSFVRHDDTLARYVIARLRADGRPDVAASFKMLRGSLEWRARTRPDAGPTAGLRAEASTGKCYVGGIDVYGRPVLVLDADKENHVGSLATQMAHLAFELEYASRLLRARAAAVNGVTRFVIFVKLGDFNVSTAPSLRTTHATARTLLDNYPERLGQCVFFQPPAIFGPLWRAVATVLPQSTLDKVAFVSGDVSAGSANDARLAGVIGPRWRELTGAGLPVLAPRCSPGFHPDFFWHAVERDWERIERGEQPLGPDWPMRVPQRPPSPPPEGVDALDEGGSLPAEERE